MSAATTEIIARAVIRRDGQLLLVRQRTKAWSFLPGGHIEPGERVEVDLRPGALKNVLMTAGEDRTPCWHGWAAELSTGRQVHHHALAER